MNMIRQILTATALVSTLAAAPMALAGDIASGSPDRIVELFTSQGCSSCPPANSFVSNLAADPDVLALTYGVHYWDYLGWKDTFASPEFTARQRAYGKAFGAPNVYTPQIVLNGAAHSPRYTAKDVASMQLASSRPTVSLGETDGELTYAIDHNADFKVVIVTYKPGLQEVPVKRGENGGRKLTMSNVVTDIAVVDEVGDTDVEIKPGLGYAVLVHDPKSAKIVTAAVLKSE